MAKYTVKSNVKHKGKIVEPGKSIDLDEDAAAPLLEAGVIEAPAAKAAPEKTGK